MDIPNHNTGFIEGSGTKDLWIGGTIPYEVRNKSGDWRLYLVTEEHQYSHNTDTMACVSFSCNNSLEIQSKFFGVDVNFSDRFLAKMSGTTLQGNYLDKVADTARRFGLVKEEEWPAPDDYTWNSYYASIPQSVINKAVNLDIAYESIGPEETSLLYHLKQAPIQIVIPEPYPNHAVVLVAIENGLAYYFDTYPPYLKSISLNKIHAAMKIVLKGPMFPIKKVKINGAWGVLIDMPNGSAITKAEDEAEWRSYSKPDSYRIHSVNDNGSTDWSVDLEINF